MRVLIYLSLICHLFSLVYSGNSGSRSARDNRHVQLCLRDALEILFGSIELYKLPAGNPCMCYPVDSVLHLLIPALVKASASQVNAFVLLWSFVVKVPLGIKKPCRSVLACSELFFQQSRLYHLATDINDFSYAELSLRTITVEG